MILVSVAKKEKNKLKNCTQKKIQVIIKIIETKCQLEDWEKYTACSCKQSSVKEDVF